MRSLPCACELGITRLSDSPRAGSVIGRRTVMWFYRVYKKDRAPFGSLSSGGTSGEVRESEQNEGFCKCWTRKSAPNDGHATRAKKNRCSTSNSSWSYLTSDCSVLLVIRLMAGKEDPRSRSVPPLNPQAPRFKIGGTAASHQNRAIAISIFQPHRTP